MADECCFCKREFHPDQIRMAVPTVRMVGIEQQYAHPACDQSSFISQDWPATEGFVTEVLGLLKPGASEALRNRVRTALRNLCADPSPYTPDFVDQELAHLRKVKLVNSTELHEQGAVMENRPEKGARVPATSLVDVSTPQMRSLMRSALLRCLYAKCHLASLFSPEPSPVAVKLPETTPSRHTLFEPVAYEGWLGVFLQGAFVGFGAVMLEVWGPDPYLVPFAVGALISGLLLGERLGLKRAG